MFLAHIDLTIQALAKNKVTEYWLKDLLLYPFEKNSLSQGNWLTDSVINAAQTLLKQQFPHVGGLLEAVLADTLGFEIQRGEFVQILKVRRSYWITISNIGCQDGVVNVYDSMPNCDIPRRTKEQIAVILLWKKITFDSDLKQFKSNVEEVIVACSLWHLLHHYAWGMTTLPAQI